MSLLSLGYELKFRLILESTLPVKEISNSLRIIELLNERRDYMAATEIKKGIANHLAELGKVQMALTILREVYAFLSVSGQRFESRNVSFELGVLAVKVQQFNEALYWFEIAARKSNSESEWPTISKAKIQIAIIGLHQGKRNAKSKLDAALSGATALGMFDYADNCLNEIETMN